MREQKERREEKLRSGCKINEKILLIKINLHNETKMYIFVLMFYCSY